MEQTFILSNIFKKMLGMRMVSIIQPFEVFRRMRKLLQTNLPISTANGCRISRKPECAASTDMYFPQASFCLKRLWIILQGNGCIILSSSVQWQLQFVHCWPGDVLHNPVPSHCICAVHFLAFYAIWQLQPMCFCVPEGAGIFS